MSEHIISDLKVQILKNDSGLDLILAKWLPEKELPVNDLIHFRSEVIDFLISQLEVSKIKKIGIEQAAEIVGTKYDEIMLTALLPY